MTVKRRLALLLVLTLVLSVVNVGSIQAAENAAIGAENISAAPGQEISVPVMLRNNSGILGFTIYVSYDKNILEPGEVTPAEAFNKNFISGTRAIEGKDVVQASWGGTTVVAGDQTLFTLKFKVLDQAQAGKTILSYSYKKGDTFSEIDQYMELDCTDTAVTIGSGQSASSETENPTPQPDPQPQSDPQPQPDEDSTDTGCIVYYENVETTPDKELTIPICIKNNPGLLGFLFNIRYDGEALTPEEITQGPAITGGGITTNIKEPKDSTLKVQWAGADPMTENGELFSIRFKVDPQAAAQNIKLEITCSQEDTFIRDYEEVPVKCAPGVIAVKAGDQMGTDSTEKPTDTEKTDTEKTDSTDNSSTMGKTGNTTNSGTANNTKTTNTTQNNSKAQTSTGKSNTTAEQDKKIDSILKYLEKQEKAKKVEKPKKVKGVGVYKYKKRKGFLVVWNRVDATGYQVQYALNIKFTKNKKSKKTKKLYISLKKLKKKKRYYIRVRAYNKKNGVTKYGKWSKVKKVKL